MLLWGKIYMITHLSKTTKASYADILAPWSCSVFFERSKHCDTYKVVIIKDKKESKMCRIIHHLRRNRAQLFPMGRILEF